MPASITLPKATSSNSSAHAIIEDRHHLTPAEAACYLNLPENALAKMRLNGDGPRFIKIGRRVRYAKATVDEWLSARTYSNTACAAHDSGATHDR